MFDASSFFNVAVFVIVMSSSSRFIKRRKFDDELVESSLSTTGSSVPSRPGRVRTHSVTNPAIGENVICIIIIRRISALVHFSFVTLQNNVFL